MSRWCWDAAVETIFPPQCLACQVDLPEGRDASWCRGCLSELVSAPNDCCPRCGAASATAKFPDDRCPLCRKYEFQFDQALAIGNYTGLMKQLIVEMKGQFDEVLALQLGRLLAGQIRLKAPAFQPDLIVPVPTVWWNRTWRPCIVSEVIAEGVSQKCHSPVCQKAIQCTRKTEKQGTMLTPARFENVKGAFAVRLPRRVVGRSILVVDDVMTSGATVNEIGKLLRRAGAHSVVVATVARGARLT